MSDGRVFHSDGPATEKLRGPKPTVLVLGTVRSPLPTADRRWRRVDTAEIGEIIDSIQLQYTSIGTTVAKLWPFLYVQDGRQPPSWILSNRK